VAKRKRPAAHAASATSGTIAQNRRGRYDYEILANYEAGIVLLGSEIKSIRAGHAIITEGYARLRDGELWLENVHIAPYPPARENHEPTRPRKLLLRRAEIERLRRTLGENPRTTLVALRLYLKGGRAKVELGLGRGRRAYDKRQAIASREADRSMQRALRHAVREPAR
jgi:SsrA-binding protein